MTHRMPKVAVPIRAVLGKVAAVIHGVRHIRQVVALAGHPCAGIFGIDSECAWASWVLPHAAGNRAS